MQIIDQFCVDGFDLTGAESWSTRPRSSRLSHPSKAAAADHQRDPSVRPQVDATRCQCLVFGKQRLKNAAPGTMEMPSCSTDLTPLPKTGSPPNDELRDVV